MHSKYMSKIYIKGKNGGIVLDTRIKELREARGIGQAVLADFVQSSQQTISRIESGKSDPSVELLGRIADYFNVTLDYLLYRSDFRTSLEIQLQFERDYDKYYKILSVYKQLDEHDRITSEMLVNRLLDKQKRTSN